MRTEGRSETNTGRSRVGLMKTEGRSETNTGRSRVGLRRTEGRSETNTEHPCLSRKKWYTGRTF